MQHSIITFITHHACYAYHTCNHEHFTRAYPMLDVDETMVRAISDINSMSLCQCLIDVILQFPIEAQRLYLGWRGVSCNHANVDQCANLSFA